MTARILLAATFAFATPCLAAPADADGGDTKPAPARAADRTTPSTPTPAEVEAEMKRLLGALESNQKKTRDEAAEALGRMDVKEVGPRLKKQLKSDQAETRRVVLRLMRDMSYRGAGSQIAKILHGDQNALVRREAAHAVAELAPDRAVEALRGSALTDREVKVRRAAILELGRLERLDGVEALVDLLEDSRNDIVIEESHDYLVKMMTRALTLATGKNYGSSVESWRAYIATKQDQMDELDLDVTEVMKQD